MPHIIIYHIEYGEYSAFENTGASLQDGSGLKAAEIIIQKKVGALLTNEIGRKAYSVLTKEHIDIHLMKFTGSVKSVMNKYLKI